jgi:hypothetical protein
MSLLFLGKNVLLRYDAKLAKSNFRKEYAHVAF